MSVFAESKEALRWYLTDWPPAFILEGANKGKGYADEIIDLLEVGMPNFKHERVVIPYPRILSYLESGEEGCYPTNIYEKKHDYGLVSAPIILVTGHNIYIHQSKKNLFPVSQKISLAAILQNRDIKLGIRGDLEFGPTLSPILKKHKDQENVILRTSPDLADGLVKMLALGRFDFLIEYNFVMKFVTDKLGVPMADFVEIPIKENQGEFVRGAIECPDTKWGQQIIAQINDILNRTRDTIALRELNEKWFVSKSNEDSYWGKYQQLVLNVSD